MWSDIFLHDTPKEKYAIVLMDTQGLFEPGSIRDDNERIFGLSTLLSSIQIFNIKDVLKEDQLVHLELATSLTNLIEKKGKPSQWKPFQRLLFLFRDWADETIGFGYEGGRQYLTDTVLEETGDEERVANVVRRHIYDAFDEILCYLLNHPGLGVTKRSFKGEWSKLDQVFVTKLKLLIESILRPENLVKKTVLGNAVKAEDFRTLISAYFNAFANATLPDTETILQLTINNQLQTIVNDQLKFFNKLQAELDVDYDRENFFNWINQAQKNNTETALDGFSTAEKFDDEESSLKFKNILKEEIKTASKVS